MRVAYILPSLRKPGGWRSHALAFLGAIAAHVQPVIFVARAEADEARALFPHYPIFSLPATQMPQAGRLRRWLSLALGYVVLRRGRLPRVDLVHSLEAYPSGLLGHWLARRLGCPHILTAHGTYGVIWRQYPLDRGLYQNVLRQASLICPVSEATARRMRECFPAPLAETPIRVILNGNHFTHAISRAEVWERPSPPIPTLLTVGDVKPRKGQHLSLAAFARVKERLPSARYWIVGNYSHNAYFLNLQRFIQERGLQDVTFMGTVSDEALKDLFRRASLFVLTPQEESDHFEGFGLVYLEAGAYGLPVVGTRCGGVGEAVREGVTGLLAEPNDVEGIAEAILRLLTEAELAQRMGRENRLWAETLTWERNAAEFFRAYQEVLR